MASFDPLVKCWFSRRVGSPTPMQRRAWEAIGRGSHVLVSAPTGSGKTLAAFLWALDRLATGAWSAGGPRVLYVSPLRALNNDIRENLVGPLEGLRGEFEAAGRSWPDPRVAVRSGDTPPSERRAQIRHPAEILITTPESLAILLSHDGGRDILRTLRTVILDEIHAVAAARRGALLVASVERVARLAGEVQRIALSATVRPADRLASFVGGYLADGSPRPVEIVQDPSAKEIRLSVRLPAHPSAEGSWWDSLAGELRGPIRSNRSTLVFANSRRAAEKLARVLNEGQKAPVAYSHHGSLSRELRHVVERRMRAGELPAIVATSSLELGIDIGALDEVILVQTPPSVSSALQRIGRAGHRIGESSRARLYPMPGLDLLYAAAMAGAVAEQDIEEIRVPSCPLDVLAQLVVSLAAAEEWRLDDLFAFSRRAAPFHDLSRTAFDSVIAMLCGRVKARRVRDLPVRLVVDEQRQTARGADGAASLVRLAGGTIPDRGLYALVMEGSGVKIGDLDEEFVWERKVGETFALGAQSWLIRSIDDKRVLVAPAPDRAGLSPFWRADPAGRDFRFACRVADLLESLAGRLDDPAAADDLARGLGGARQRGDSLLSLLRLQREVTGCQLPHRRHLVVEHVADPAGNEARGRPSGVTSVCVLHTLWGGRVNRTFALLLADVLEEKLAIRAAIHHDDAAVMVGLPAGRSPLGAEELLALARPQEIERRVSGRLLASGLFGARFREAAQVALLVPRPGPRRRMPLWLTRLRARRLLEAVRDAGAFPLVSEALRTALEQDCDVSALREVLEDLQAGATRVSQVSTAVASPFAAGLVRQQTGAFMYQDDTPPLPPEPSIYREVIASSHLRPALDPRLVAEFEARLKRLAPGYAPLDARELEDWAVERVMLAPSEWQELLAACERDSGGPAGEPAASAAPHLAWLELGAARYLVARRSIPRLRRAFGSTVRLAPLKGAEAIPSAGPPRPGDEEELLALVEETVSFSGPFPIEALSSVAQAAGRTAEELAAQLVERDSIVVGELVRGNDLPLACDRTNLERLLALGRREQRPALAPLPAAKLPLFVAAIQGLARADSRAGPAAVCGAGAEQEVAAALDPLLGYPLPAALWETAVLPARVAGYRPAWLDALLRDTDLLWFGAKKGRVVFALARERALWCSTQPSGGPPPGDPLFPDPQAWYGFWDLAARTGLPSGELARRLWALVWQGLATTDGFAPVRRGAALGFEAEEAAPPDPARRSRGIGYGRWLSSRPAEAAWRYLSPPQAAADSLDDADRDEQRAYQILDRYGIVFRALIAGEMPHVRWSRLFRRLRVLELAGEVTGGAFFEGIEGPQFVSAAGLRLLREGLPERAVFWMSAADPASLAGVRVKGLALPRRRPGTLLVYAGSELILVARRNGKEIEISVPADDPRLPRALEALTAIVEREVGPVRLLRVERINGAPAAAGPYRDAFVRAAFRGEGCCLALRPELARNRQ